MSRDPTKPKPVKLFPTSRSRTSVPPFTINTRRTTRDFSIIDNNYLLTMQSENINIAHVSNKIPADSGKQAETTHPTKIITLDTAFLAELNMPKHHTFIQNTDSQRDYLHKSFKLSNEIALLVC